MRANCFDSAFCIVIHFRLFSQLADITEPTRTFLEMASRLLSGLSLRSLHSSVSKFLGVLKKIKVVYIKAIVSVRHFKVNSKVKKVNLCSVL